MKQLLRTGAVASALGLFGCSSPAPTPAEVTSTTTSALTTPNQICANWSPRGERDWHCENTDNVGNVYAQAKQKAGAKAGTIALWVNWPGGEGQEANVAAINGWFARARTVVTWLKGQADLDLFARSIAALDTSRAKLVSSQQQLLNQRKGGVAEAIQAVQAKVNEQVNDPEKVALLNTLAETRIKLAELREILDRTKATLTALQPQYEALVAEFKAYRATEPAVTADIKAFVDSASSADLTQLATIKVSVTDYERSVATQSSALRVHAQEMRGLLLAAQAQHDAAIAPYGQFFASRALTPTDFVGTALRSAGNMIAYCESRQTATDRAVARLVDGLRARTDALVELAAAQATRDTLAATRFADASTAFLEQSNTRIAQLWAAPPTSPTRGYPLYMAQYDAFAAFLQLEPLCSQAALASSSWMKAGCSAMQPSFARARDWMRDTPGALRMRLVLLRRNGANENLCVETETQLNAGKLRAGISAYDAAVHLLDPQGVTP